VTHVEVSLKVLVIGGGRWQIPLCEFLSSRNFDVVIADPSVSHQCLGFATTTIQYDIRNHYGILSEVSAMGEKPALILSDQSDLAIETASFLSSQFDLPGIAPRICELFRNKLHFRRFLESELGVTFPRYYQIQNMSDIELAIVHLGFPFVIKPADSQSSRGFSVVSSSDVDLERIVKDALSHTKLSYVLAEQFIPGTEVTVEGISVNGRHQVTASSSKMHFRPGIASRLDFPARITKQHLDSLVEFHNHLIEMTGLENALTHAEYMVDSLNGRFSPVEIACRGGGNLISSDIVPWISGLDTYSILLNALLGIDTKIVLEASTRCATLQFFEFGNGVVPQLPDLSDLNGFSGKVISEFNVKTGQIIGPATDDRSRHGFVILLAENLADLEIARTRVNQLFEQASR
jgi:hypothetical protein